MNEPLAPHGFYDGPVKELAARHLALIKAVFILLLVSVPGCLFIAILDRDRGYSLLACGFALHGFGLLFYRFFRLAKLLYPHMVFYFTALLLVPFLNVVVIFLLLRSALQQMRQMGLRVGVFGIDPARFD